MAAETDPTDAANAPLGHKVDAAGGERLHYLGMEFAIRASAESTGGAFSIVEEFDPLDTPLHIHHSHNELFYVLEGEHVFTVGDIEVWAGPGDVVFGPRGVPMRTGVWCRVVVASSKCSRQPASRLSSENSLRRTETGRSESRIYVESLKFGVTFLV
jgi:mannose-6-phosphate isomerase-like protein (cupin superfamily)